MIFTFILYVVLNIGALSPISSVSLIQKSMISKSKKKSLIEKHRELMFYMADYTLESFKDCLSDFPHLVNKPVSGSTLVYIATLSERVDIVEYLLDEGADLETKSSIQNSLLSLAVQKRNKKLVELLIQRGANVRAANKEGLTPLSYSLMPSVIDKGGEESRDIVSLLTDYAVKSIAVYQKAVHDLLNDDLESFKNLCSLNKLLIHVTGGKGNETLLHLALEKEKWEFAQFLIEQGADIEKKDGSQKEPLFRAICENNKKKVEFLLQNQACLLSESYLDKHAMTFALEESLTTKNFDILKVLIKYGAFYIPYRGENADPLLYAIEKGRPELVEFLLSENILDTKKEGKEEKGQEALWHSLISVKNISRQTSIVSLLIEKGVSINQINSSIDRTPLMYAIEIKNDLLVQELLKQGADTTIVDSNQKIAFDYLVENFSFFMKISVIFDWVFRYTYEQIPGHPSIESFIDTIFRILNEGNLFFIRHILSRGDLYVKIKNEQGQNLLNTSILSDHPILSCVVINMMNSLDEKDQYGNTALFLAVQKGQIDTIKLLLESGAKIDVTNNAGETIFDVCQKEKQSQEIVDLIRRYQQGEKLQKIQREENLKKVQAIFKLIEEKNQAEKEIQKAMPQEASDLLICDMKGNTALHKAIQTNAKIITARIIEKQEEFEQKNDQNQTVLMVAIQNSKISYQTIEKLLKKGAKIETKDKRDDDAFDYLMRYHRYELIPLFFQYMNLKTYEGKEFDSIKRDILLAIEAGNLVSLKKRLNESIKYLDIPLRRSSWLFYALQCHETQIVELLIQKGVNVNQKDEEGVSPLIKAVEINNKEAVKLLLKAGANPLIKDNQGRTVWFFARNDLEMIQLLVSKGVNLHLEPMLLHQAIQAQNYEIAYFLIQNHFNLNIVNQRGQTVLVEAINIFPISNRVLQLIETLIDYGADVRGRDREGTPILMLAYNLNDMKGRRVRMILKKDPSTLYMKNREGRCVLEETLKDYWSFPLREYVFYDSSSQEEKDAFFCNNYPQGDLQKDIKFVQFYGPSNEILKTDILTRCDMWQGLALLAYIPDVQIAPEVFRAVPEGKLKELLTLFRKDKEKFIESILSIGLDEDKEGLIPKLIQKYCIESKGLLKQPKEACQVLEGYLKKCKVSYSCNWYTVLTNFLRSFDKENRIELLNYFLNQDEIQKESNRINQSLFGCIVSYCLGNNKTILWHLIRFIENERDASMKKTIMHLISFLAESSFESREDVQKMFENIRTTRNRAVGRTECISHFFDLDLYFEIKLQEQKSSQYSHKYAETLWLANQPNLFQEYILKFFDEFTCDFKKGMELFFSDFYMKSSRGELLKHLIPLWIKRGQEEMISFVIESSSCLYEFEKKELFNFIVEEYLDLVQIQHYPILMTKGVLNKKSNQIIKEKITDSWGKIKKEFIRNPSIYLKRDSDYFLEFLKRCTEDNDAQEVVEVVFNKVEEVPIDYLLSLLPLVEKYLQVLTKEKIDFLIKQYLSDEREALEKFVPLISKYIENINLDSELLLTQEKVLYVCLLYRQKERIKTLDISFDLAFKVLSCWVQKNPKINLKAFDFFSEEEIKQLEEVQAYMFSFVNYENIHQRESFQAYLDKLGLTKEKLDDLGVNGSQVYRDFIYPWGTLLTCRTFQIKPQFQYKKPSHMRELTQKKQQLLDKQTPCWEIFAWIQLNQPEDYEMLMSFFNTIWEVPESHLCQKLQKVCPIIFLELQHNEVVQDQFKTLLIELKKVFENVEAQERAENLLKQFIEENINEEDIDLPLQFLNFVAYLDKDYYFLFKHFFQEELGSLFLQKVNLLEEGIIINLSQNPEWRGVQDKETFSNFLERHFIQENEKGDKVVDLSLEEEKKEILKNYLEQTLTWLNNPLSDNQIRTRYQEEENQIYLPYLFLNQFEWEEVECSEKLEGLLRNNTNHIVFKKLCCYQKSIVMEFYPISQDSVKKELEQILLSAKIGHKSEEDQEVLDKLDHFLEKHCQWIQTEKIEEDYKDYLFFKNKKQVSVGDVIFCLLASRLDRRGKDFDSYQLWKHRLLNYSVPFSDVMMNKQEDKWYRNSFKTLRGIEKQIIIEDEQTRRNHLENLSFLVGKLYKCAAQSQNFFISANMILRTNPPCFKDVKDAFCDAAMNCRSGIIHDIYHDLKRLRREVHTINSLYQIALFEEWGIEEATEENLTNQVDSLGGIKEKEEVVKLFNEKYQFTSVLFHYFLRYCMGESFYTKEDILKSKKRDKPETPYASVVSQCREVLFWDEALNEEHHIAFKPEGLLAILLNQDVIEKKEGLIKFEREFLQINKKDKNLSTLKLSHSFIVKECLIRSVSA